MVEQLRSMKLKEAAQKVEDSEETLTYCDFPSEHWTRIRTNVIETAETESAACTRVVGEFPRTATPPSCWSVPGCAMGHPVGQQEVHEHEAPGGCP